MNETIRLLHSHRSDRDFTGEPVTDDELDAIVSAAHHAPSSRNAQQVSLIVIRNIDTRRRLVEILKGQPHIVTAAVFILVVADFHKTSIGVELAGAEQVFHRSLEGYTVGTVDAGIALATLLTAARSLGLGAVPVGAIRNNLQPIVDLLKLPKWTFPVVGISIGHIAKPAQPKPRLPITSFRHDETYREEAILPAIQEYDETLLQYWVSLGRQDGVSWSRNLLPYSRSLHPQTKIVAEQQGFVNVE